MAIDLPQWLEALRSREIVERVMNDPRSVELTILGFDIDTAQHEILDRGQANFDEPWGDLTPKDRALVYAYCNQLGHLEELYTAFYQLFQHNSTLFEPVVIDLGCGPCTGGLAFAGTQSKKPRFDYIGVDQARSMRTLGEHLASNTTHMDDTCRQWTADIPSVSWRSAPSWRPVLVIASYLLASQTLNPVTLINQLECLLRKIGNGPATVFYTNSSQPEDNRRFPDFQDALTGIGFKLIVNDLGVVETKRRTRKVERKLRYALFHRPSKQTLNL